MRVTSRNRPPELKERLEALCLALCAHHRISYSITVKGTAYALGPQTENELLEIAREAIENTLQHAKATSIRMELYFSKPLFQLVIMDDGLGIAGAILSYSRQLSQGGFVLMCESADRIGATLRIDSGHTEGTRIQIGIEHRGLYAPRLLKFARRLAKLLIR